MTSISTVVITMISTYTIASGRLGLAPGIQSGTVACRTWLKQMLHGKSQPDE